MSKPKQSHRRTRRTYNDEFKAEVVALVRGGQSVAEVSRNLDLTSSAVRAWIKRAEPAQESPISDDDKAELTRLRAEVKRLRQERDILAKATAIRWRTRARIRHGCRRVSPIAGRTDRPGRRSGCGRG